MIIPWDHLFVVPGTLGLSSPVGDSGNLHLHSYDGAGGGQILENWGQAEPE